MHMIKQNLLLYRVCPAPVLELVVDQKPSPAPLAPIFPRSSFTRPVFLHLQTFVIDMEKLLNNARWTRYVRVTLNSSAKQRHWGGRLGGDTNPPPLWPHPPTLRTPQRTFLQLSFSRVLWAVWVGASWDGAPVFDHY